VGHQATASPKSYASSAAPDYSQSEPPRSTRHYQESLDRSQTTPSGATSVTGKPRQRSRAPKPPCCQASSCLTSKLDKHAETKQRRGKRVLTTPMARRPSVAHTNRSEVATGVFVNPRRAPTEPIAGGSGSRYTECGFCRAHDSNVHWFSLPKKREASSLSVERKPSARPLGLPWSRQGPRLGPKSRTQPTYSRSTLGNRDHAPVLLVGLADRVFRGKRVQRRSTFGQLKEHRPHEKDRKRSFS
jgi:hypothetical protein